MAMIMKDGVPLISIPVNIDDTTPRPNAAYSSETVQGLIDTLTTTQLVRIDCPTDLPSTDINPKGLYVLLQNEVDPDTHEIIHYGGVYIRIQNQWYELTGIDRKVNIHQGAENAGKILQVDEHGDLVLVDPSSI